MAIAGRSTDLRVCRATCSAAALHPVPVTPTLSVDTVQLRLIRVLLTTDAVNPVGLLGGVVSAAGGTVTVAELEALPPVPVHDKV